MSVLPSAFWEHDESCCGRSPIVGAVYRKMSRNILTGEELGFRQYKVIEVDPIRHDRIMCRRMVLQCDEGAQLKPQVANFWSSNYEAVDNVVPLTKEES